MVLSIVLLGLEIRQTRLAIIGETFMARSILVSEADTSLANSDYLPSIEFKYSGGGLEALTPEERIRWGADANAAKVRFDGLLFQYENGLLNEDYYQYTLLPALRFWIPRWEDLDMLKKSRTRPGFRSAIAQAKMQGQTPVE